MINSYMIDITQYAISDGTYKSPKNSKIYKSAKAFVAHMSYKGHVDPDTFAKRLVDVECQHCRRLVKSCSIKKHEVACYLNPDNMVLCKQCNEPIKNYKHNKGTCSKGCANKFYRSGENNGNWLGGTYQSICFSHHEKKCVVCGETKIVAVHHYDLNHKNDDPKNLVPLCPTHHSYVHSRYVGEVQPIIDEYVSHIRV